MNSEVLKTGQFLNHFSRDLPICDRYFILRILANQRVGVYYICGFEYLLCFLYNFALK